MRVILIVLVVYLMSGCSNIEDPKSRIVWKISAYKLPKTEASLFRSVNDRPECGSRP
jgi:hypothetical protein